MNGETFHLEYKKIKKITDKAFLFVLKNGREVWIPTSQIVDELVTEDNQFVHNEGDKNGSITITAWIAKQKEKELGK